MGSAPYWELRLAPAGEATEGLTNFLWEEGALGVLEEETAQGTRLRAFFTAGAATATLPLRMRRYLDGLRSLGFPAPDDLELVPLGDTDWGQAWREHFRPLAVGRRFLVAPPWEMPAPDGRLVLVIEPGRAFGTGHHGSTAGCLEALEAVVAGEPPPAAIDLGTGSGILAIAAARLGVGHVLAADADPDAVAAARANAVRNGVADRVTCILADVASLETRPAPVVLANLLPAAHLSFGARYARYVAPGGILVAGGIPDADAAGIVSTLAGHGFRRAVGRVIDGWTTLALRLAPTDPADAPVHDRP
jgi:ribosomal protein L11 methyltransferase